MQYQDQLKINTWHHYSGPLWGWRENNLDHYNESTSNYEQFVRNIINDNNINKGLRTLMDRPVFQYIIGGQRIDYQCERLANSYSTNNPFWFYAYDNSVLESTVDYNIHDVPVIIENKEEMVKYCQLLNNSVLEAPIIIDKNIRANREMSFNQVNDWMKDNKYGWYVMPRIKIDPNYANNLANFNNTVCKIVIKGWYENDIVQEIDIKVKNFKQYDTTEYNGIYRESFYMDIGQNPDYFSISKSQLSRFTTNDPDNEFVFDWDNIPCYCDFEIYWTGACDLWIDRIRIENQPAHEYLTLTDPWHNELETKVQSEISWASQNYNSLYPIPNYFYFEECQMSHFPSIKRLNNDIITATGDKNDLIIWLNYDLFKAHVPYCWNYQFNSEMLRKYLYDEYGLRNIVMGSYFLEGWGPGDNMGDYRNSYHPKTLLDEQYSKPNGVLSYRLDTSSVYDQKLQQKIDDVEHISGVNLGYINRLMFEMSKVPEMQIVNCPQAHLWYQKSHKLKEPSNQELELQVNLAISYNAKGIMWFSFIGDGDNFNLDYFNKGIMEHSSLDNSIVPRQVSVYNQNKYNAVCNINAKLQKWGPYILNFEPAETKNCAYYLVSEREDFLSYTYFGDIISYKYETGMPPCVTDNPGDPQPGILYDCNYDRYIQAATFKEIGLGINKYFMIVNRRCSPFINNDNENNRGGKRLIKVRFDANASDFDGFNDWVITDLETGNKVLTFDKRYSTLLNLGDYQPAQGRLYKISPLALEGGTLVSDETLSGNIMCKGKINNNGFNITLDQGTTITFSDSAGIEMNGGTFTCGVNADNVDAVTLQKASNGSGWNGLVLNNCPNVGIYNTNFSGIKANDTAKAVLISNCGNVYFRKSNFTPSNNAGAIQTVYTNPSFDSLSFRVQECNFYMGQSGYSGISIISNASMTVPIVIEWCTFNTSNDTSNAILMNNITGGAIKNNVITNFSKSIIASSSVIDIYRNTIIGNSGSYGLRCLAGSDLKLKTVSGYYLGGENYIRNYGTSSSCIYSDNSLFDINNGENHFDLSDTVDSKFLTGTLGGVPSDNVDAAKNCFHLDSVNNIEANHTMTWYGTSDPVSFTFIAYNCELTQPQDFMVFNYGGYNDTVYYNPGGEGSGFNPDKAMNMQEGSYRSLRDTINLNLRKRNYAVVEDKAKQLLTQYPDSLESIGMVQKLYIASLTLDQNGNKIGQLKTYLENLISSNQQNPGLTKRAFYHIQKCKVKLGQYQSALDGFQYIMTQNPYSYEGLVASWDYAATYLLMGQGGSLSGDTEEMTEELNTPADTLLNRMSRNDSKTKSGSDGQKTKIFYEKVKMATKDDKTVQEEKVKQLEKTIESSKSDVSKTKAQTELAVMKTIKESVKIKKPNSVRTHIAIVNSDIKKIFGIGKSTSSNTKNNLIPTMFELHQNYPNPFNPSTKIAFDLPKDAKVKLVIYDILGREIKTLIHNEFRAAGKYITEFNGSNLASGVYFYRLQAGDFVSVKKMVMIK